MANKKIQTNVSSRFGKPTLTSFGEIKWSTDGTAEVSEDVFNKMVESGDESIFPFGKEVKKEEVKESDVQPIQKNEFDFLQKEVELNKVIGKLTEELGEVMSKYNLVLIENENLKKEYESLQKEAEKLATMVDELNKPKEVEVSDVSTTLEQEIAEMKVSEMLDLAKNLDLPSKEYQGLKKDDLATYLISKTKG